MSAANKVINQHSFHDGKVVLYQLENRPKGLWLCRIKVPNGVGYKYRGTGTSDFYTARKFADDLLDEMRLEIKLGKSVTGTDIKRLVQEFEAQSTTDGKIAHRDQAIVAFLRTYAVPFFTKNKITRLTSVEITRFFDWRRQNPRKANKTPKASTIIHEMSMFQTFLKWCQRRGHIDHEIILERPKDDGHHRPHFNEREWATLTRFLREWVKQAEKKRGPIYRDRVMLVNYILVLANTGIRVGEARTLRWRDIDAQPTHDDPEKFDIFLQVRGKTGARDVVARTSDTQTYFNRIWDLRCVEIGEKPSREQFVFCHKDGSQIQSFKKGFDTLIKQIGLDTDEHGERRTIYSLRHTYATFRLHEGVNHYALARNMGTSVKMLENFYGHTMNRAMASELTKNRQRRAKSLPWD